MPRAEDVLTIQGIILNKRPRTWKKEQIYLVLRDCDVGVGLDDEEFELFNYVKPLHFQNIMDALICFDGHVLLMMVVLICSF